MDDWMLLGLVAGLLTTIGFVPQLIRGYRTKRMGDVSLAMPVVLSLGMFLWLMYGLMKNDAPIIIWNAIALMLNLAIVLLKIRYAASKTA
ncbi:MAG TPA: SemiSWEET transporter [Methanomassiliicoccales archaeon]|nr:SemiSWEET transporter [Methanomassiliicoccales archaeon]